MITCDSCGLDSPNTQQKKVPDGGWELPFDLFGYYGGFDDNMRVLVHGDESRTWILCHDCVVKLFETFPRLAQKFDKSGCHPNNIHKPKSDRPEPDGTNTPSCCSWAWTLEKQNVDGKIEYTMFIGDGNGGWLKAPER